MSLDWACEPDCTDLLRREVSHATDTMQRVYAEQYDCPAVLLTDPPVDADRVIDYARLIGAECAWDCEPDEQPDLVISFACYGRLDPETWTEGAVRETITHQDPRA